MMNTNVNLFTQPSYNITCQFHTPFINYTSLEFTEEKTSLISKGFKFNLDTYNNKQHLNNIEKLAVETEVVLQTVRFDDVEQIRDGIKNILRFEKGKIFNNNYNFQYSKISQNLLKSIKHEIDTNNISITKADQGNSMIFLYF